MFARLSQYWVYGGALAGILLLVLAPLVMPGLGLAGGLAYLALALYMLHQLEEHDADRFRLYVNTKIAKGRAGLSLADVFVINVVGVWAYFALALWLTMTLSPGWALMPGWLMLVNAIAHVGPAIARRDYNPGLWSAIVLFLPFSAWLLIRISPLATLMQQAVAIVLAVVIHAAIMRRALRPAKG